MIGSRSYHGRAYIEATHREPQVNVYYTDQFYMVVSRLLGAYAEKHLRRACIHRAFSRLTRASICSVLVCRGDAAWLRGTSRLPSLDSTSVSIVVV